MLPNRSFKAVLFLTQQFFWVNQSFNAGDVKHHRQWTCVAFNVPLKSHNICGSHEREEHPAALSFHAEWPGNIWLTANLRWCEVGPGGEGKVTGATLYVHAAHLRPLKCHMAVSAEQTQPWWRLIRELYVETVQSPNWTDGRIIFMITEQQCSPVHTLDTHTTPVVTLWLWDVI